MSFAQLYLSSDGRINRGKWWLGALGVVVFMVAVSIFVLKWDQLDWMLYTFPGRLTLFVPNMIGLLAFYMINAKRFQDRNKPKAYAQIALVIGGIKFLLDLAGVTGDWFGPNVADYIFQVVLTIIGLWYLVELGFLRGTPGDNNYGPEPLANKAA